MTWHSETWSIGLLRFYEKREEEQEQFVFPWLKKIGVVPNDLETYKEFSAYPLMDKSVLKGEHLASLAVEWDKQGPCRLTEWLDMVEFECSGNPKRDIVKEALEAIGGS